MRPIERGTAPNTYSKYQDAALDLIARLGDYCSYCERQIETHLAVEHIKPKSLNQNLRNTWSNFLLACGNCNSCKGKKSITLDNYFWPDTDNTLRALKYSQGGLITPHSQREQKAIDTIKLLGLDRYPGNKGRNPTKKDLRWLTRQRVWGLAERSKKRLMSCNTIEMREEIVETALGRGLFSIWWTVFSDDIDMRRRFRIAFTGTHSDCFDVNEETIPRTGGQI